MVLALPTAVAAALSDSPLPGPGDVVALGILATALAINTALPGSMEMAKGERGYTGNAGGTDKPEKHWKDDPKILGGAGKRILKLVRRLIKNALLICHLNALNL